MMADDRAALEALRHSVRHARPHALVHYLYFPGSEAAARAAAELRDCGFATQRTLTLGGLYATPAPARKPFATSTQTISAAPMW